MGKDRYLLLMDMNCDNKNHLAALSIKNNMRVKLLKRFFFLFLLSLKNRLLWKNKVGLFSTYMRYTNTLPFLQRTKENYKKLKSSIVHTLLSVEVQSIPS